MFEWTGKGSTAPQVRHAIGSPAHPWYHTQRLAPSALASEARPGEAAELIAAFAARYLDDLHAA